LDATFASSGILKYPFPPSAPFVIKVKFNPFDDSLFLGYSAMNNSTNNSDVALLHIDNTGLVIDFIFIDFDLGSSNDRKDDFFNDMKLFHNTNSGEGFIVIAAEVERTNASDTDFGIARINFDTSGNLSMATTFSGDGKSSCFHDHSDSGFSQDIATSISITEELHYLIGGSAFEGNGDDANGWNLAFCEYNSSGAIIKKWSTKSAAEQADSREELVETMIDRSAQDGQYLLVLSKEPDQVFSVKSDFVVRKYIRDILNDGVWDLDINFGAAGVSRIGFTDPFFFPETTDDRPAHIYIEKKNKQILLAGTSFWQENGNQKSYVSMAKLNSNGLLNTSWGINQTGKAYLSLDTTAYADECAGLVEDPNSEEIYITGTHFDFGNNTISSFTANIVNDLIFKGGFD
jgi:hypothetical protein